MFQAVSDSIHTYILLIVGVLTERVLSEHDTSIQSVISVIFRSGIHLLCEILFLYMGVEDARWDYDLRLATLTSHSNDCKTLKNSDKL